MTVDDIISAAGGVGKLAHLVGVSHSSVCDWRRAQRIPVERALAIHERLSISLSEIRPDVWLPPATDTSAPEHVPARDPREAPAARSKSEAAA